jgi:signal transduction histidine kinase
VDALAATSFVVLLGLGGAYFFVYRLHRRVFFYLMGLAWLFNFLYVLTEALAFPGISNPLYRQLLAHIAALPSAYLIFLSYFNIDFHESRFRIPKYQIFWWSLAISVSSIAAIVVGQFSRDARLWVLLAPGVFFTAWALLRLGYKLLQKSDEDILSILGAFTIIESPPVASLSEHIGLTGRRSQAESVTIPEVARRPISLGRSLCGYSLIGYGLMQFLYFLKIRQEILPLFWVALSLKACNGLGLVLLALADFRAVGEAYRLQSLAAELGALTASVEHDIRNPISTMKKTLATLKQKFQHDAGVQRAVNSLDSQIARINSAVDVIPQLRETDSYYQQRFKRWNLVEIAYGSAKAIRDTYKGPLQPRVEVTSSHPEIIVLAFRERLLQAIVNIITNSLEAYEDSSEVKSALVKVNCSMNRENGTAQIAVHDEAGGVSRDIVSMITRPMFSTKGGGGKSNRGIGLFTADRFVRHHQGKLEFDTDHSTYTTVVIELPLYKKGES